MIKYAAFALQFVSLSIFNLFFPSAIIDVQNSTPATLHKGERKEIEIVINKGDVQGFAKMEIVLPTGMIASAGETNGASFTFSAQKARFVWMSLPSQSNFKVTYFLEAMDGIVGKKDIRGIFSYIADNRRVDYNIPIKTIDVVADAAPILAETAPTATQDSTPASTPETESVLTVPVTPITPSAPPASSPEAPVVSAEPVQEKSTTPAPVETASVSIETPQPAINEETMILDATRTITALTASDFRVDIKMESRGITGFAKIVENVPAGYSISKVQDAGSTVTIEKGLIKFVWFEIPNSPLIEVTYKISSPNAATVAPAITGELSYVENNNPKKKPIVSSGEVVLAAGGTIEPVAPVEPVAENKPTPTEDKKIEPKEETKSTNESAEVKKETPAPKETKIQPKKEVTAAPSPEVGITYKVQILAAHRVVNKTYFSAQHNFSEGFNIENHEGWVKYTTGKFEEYKIARDERERLKSNYNLPGPFVTAYNNGERITVQEALLITKQQWYQ
jgi:outer membrane biosynthesis protein TonB